MVIRVEYCALGKAYIYLLYLLGSESYSITTSGSGSTSSLTTSIGILGLGPSPM